MLVLTGEPRKVTDLAFSPDAKLLATTSDRGGLEMWDIPARRKWGRFTGGISFYNAPPAFHPTKPRCFSLTTLGLAVINTVAETVRVATPPADGEWLVLPAVAPDGGSLVGRARTPSGHELRRYRVRAKGPLEAVWAVPLDRLSPRSREPLDTGAIRVGPDGSTFAVLSGERDRWTWTVKPVRVSLRSMNTGEVLRSAKLPAGTTNAFAFAPDSRTFVTCRKHIMSVWTADDLKAAPREVRSDTRSHFTGIAFHPSGRYLAATSNDSTVKLYDTTTWEVARTFTWDIGRMRSVAFSPDGTLAAAGSDTGKVVVWDVDV